MFIERDLKTYATIISDGTLRVQSNENDPEAVKREIELSDGSKKVKWEKVYQGIKGKIEAIIFKETDFGTMMNVTISGEGHEDIILSLSTTTGYATDLMKKLPSINIKKEVSLSPYSLTDDKGRNKKGLTVWQSETPNGAKSKIANYFVNPETKENINGFPSPTGDTKTYSKNQWKIYFMQCAEFLIQYTKDDACKRLGDAQVQEFIDGGINVKDIPL